MTATALPDQRKLALQRRVRWIVAANKNGRFGSTQATVLALRAIIAYDARIKRITLRRRTE